MPRRFGPDDKLEPVLIAAANGENSIPPRYQGPVLISVGVVLAVSASAIFRYRKENFSMGLMFAAVVPVMLCVGVDMVLSERLKRTSYPITKVAMPWMFFVMFASGAWMSW